MSKHDFSFMSNRRNTNRENYLLQNFLSLTLRLSATTNLRPPFTFTQTCIKLVCPQALKVLNTLDAAFSSSAYTRRPPDNRLPFTAVIESPGHTSILSAGDPSYTSFTTTVLSTEDSDINSYVSGGRLQNPALCHYRTPFPISDENPGATMSGSLDEERTARNASEFLTDKWVRIASAFHRSGK